MPPDGAGPAHAPQDPAPAPAPTHPPDDVSDVQEPAAARGKKRAGPDTRKDWKNLKQRDKKPLEGFRLPSNEGTAVQGPAYRGPDGTEREQAKECRDWLKRTEARPFIAHQLLRSGELRKRQKVVPAGTSPAELYKEYVWPLITTQSLRFRGTPASFGKTTWKECPTGAYKAAAKRKAEVQARRDAGTYLGKHFACDVDTAAIVKGVADALPLDQRPVSLKVSAEMILPVAVRVLSGRGAAERSSGASALLLNPGAQLLPATYLAKIRMGVLGRLA